MSDILPHLENGILTLTFNRPERKNSLSRDMYAQLAQELEQGAESPSVRVVVFQGQEGVFTAGNDISDFLQHPPTDLDAPVFRFLFALARFPKPMLAGVCGPAVGIGTTMLLHCDMVYAGDNAAFAMPFVNLGVCPEAGSSLLAPQILGYQRAAEVLLLGEPFAAETAMEMGLVSRIMPPQEVNAYVQGVARKLASKPQSALIAAKALLKKHNQAHIEAVITDESRTFMRMLGQPAAQEALSAFMEKRKPNFENL